MIGYGAASNEQRAMQIRALAEADEGLEVGERSEESGRGLGTRLINNTVMACAAMGASFKPVQPEESLPLQTLRPPVQTQGDNWNTRACR